MSITVTALRADLYRLVDQVLEDGVPLEIERNGRILTLSATPLESKLAALVPIPDLIVGDPDSLIHHDWSDEWKPM